jgi:Protein of unknown function (DUF2934)
MSSHETPVTGRPNAMLEHRIRQRAYELYQTRVQGSDLQDWLQAEREVLAEISPSSEFAPNKEEVKLRKAG